MNMRSFLIVALIAAAWLPGCPAPPSALARAQEAAQEFNLDARFGRIEMALDRVAPAARDEFAAHHKAWGTAVRVADIELAGMHAHGEHEVEVIVRVAWYRPDQQDLRSTTLRQSWRDKDGWQLVAEQRLEGDVGLLGEAVVFERPAQAAPPAQFPTIRLGNAVE
ncbi:MAG TPA: hypothetical protein VKU41_17445 [Polyangiaceae bacterium]|nr:hypothetical protein [Polyangiaceae bacterium]